MVTFNGLQWAEMQHYQPSNPNPSSSSAGHYAQLYNAQQSSSYAHQYPYFPHQTHNGISSVQPEAGLLPPGIDSSSSYAAINPYTPLPPLGFEGQATASYGHYVPQIGALTSSAAYYQDTGAAAVQNWIDKDSIRQLVADPVSYAAAIKSLSKGSEVPMSSASMVWNNWSYPLANDATKITTNNVTQPVRCEVCKIECNSKDVYAQHIMGKKHERNMKKKEESRIDSNVPITTTMQSNPGTTEIGNLPVVDSTRLCTICNIVCNSQEVFNSHLAGKRHAIQASLISNGTQPLLAANPNPLGWSKTKTRSAVKGTWRKGVKKTKIVQSVWCEICKIDCNSKDVLDKHILGKKHKSNLEKLEETKKEASAPAATAVPAAKDPMIGPKENPAADKGKAVSVQHGKKKGAPSLGPGEDLETKRRKLMEGGAAANAVRVCSICNVVCNSETVFTFHLLGQKHINMLMKQAATAAGTTNPSGPGVVIAA